MAVVKKIEKIEIGYDFSSSLHFYVSKGDPQSKNLLTQKYSELYKMALYYKELNVDTIVFMLRINKINIDLFVTYLQKSYFNRKQMRKALPPFNNEKTHLDPFELNIYYDFLINEVIDNAYVLRANFEMLVSGYRTKETSEEILNYSEFVQRNLKRQKKEWIDFNPVAYYNYCVYKGIGECNVTESNQGEQKKKIFIIITPVITDIEKCDSPE